MQKLKETLTSRKFWATVGSVVVALANGDYQAALAMVGTYVLAQGAVDVAKALKSGG